MESLIQQIVAGLATGGIYASVALALVMIYQATEHLNFAQGEMACFSPSFARYSLLVAKSCQPEVRAAAVSWWRLPASTLEPLPLAAATPPAASQMESCPIRLLIDFPR